jgi:hypothetical protein
LLLIFQLAANIRIAVEGCFQTPDTFQDACLFRAVGNSNQAVFLILKALQL